MTSASTPKDTSLRVVVTAVLGNGFLTVIKFFGWLATGSPSMLAECIHSLADSSNQILLYVGIRQGRSKPSKEFPFGRSSARYLWNLISAMGIFFVGFGVTTYHGVSSLLNPIAPSESIWIPVVILLVSFLVEGYVLSVAIGSVNKSRGQMGIFEYIRKGDNPTAVAVLLEDGIAVVGVALALIGIWVSHAFNTGLPDAITSIFIGILLGVLAVTLAYSNGRLLIGVSAEPATEDAIKEYLEAHRAVERVVSIKTHVMGPGRLRLTAEIEFHGEILINPQQISRDAELIRSGEEDPAPVLAKTAARMVRVVGQEINEIEKGLKESFSDLDIIELEVN